MNLFIDWLIKEYWIIVVVWFFKIDVLEDKRERKGSIVYGEKLVIV